MSVQIVGLEELNGKIKALGDGVGEMLEDATREAAFYVQSQIPPYPPPPPGSRYRRTGTLGRDITSVNAVEVKRLGREVVGKLWTDLVYAPWVISEEEVAGRGPQAWMHQGRWWILQAVARDARDGVVAIYRRAVARLRREWK